MAALPAERLTEAAMQRVGFYQRSPEREGIGHCTEMTLTTLSDDGLLHVLRYLKPRELLQCRGVCRRLRDLALHPHLWRHRRLTLRNDVQLVAATLRLAPCLGTLELYLEQGQDETHFQLASLLVSTNCAISELNFTLRDTGAVFAVMVLARQATLGRLRAVSVRPHHNETNLRLLLDEILYTRGLTSIKCCEKLIECDADVSMGPRIPNAAKGNAVPASLRRLKYGLQDGTLPYYLQWHAETLQEVLLGGKVKPPAGTAAQLAALPLLRRLECPPLDDMPALLQCPALEKLYLHVNVDASTRPFLPGVLEYLRQAVADRLKTLTLQFKNTSTDPLAGADEDDVVLSLAGPGRGAASSLRSLRLDHDAHYCNAWQPQPELDPLASVLHRLVNLVSLDLGGPPTTDFLEAMDGTVLPRLERLSVFIGSEGHSGWGRECPHEWAHGDEPRALLRRYPRLHLVVDPSHRRGSGCYDCGYRGCEICKCGFCDSNSCHDFESASHVLFSHQDHELCNKDLLEFVDREFRVD